MEKLERCPYCGSTHVRTTSVEVEAGRNHWAFCTECSASGPTSPSKEEAVRRWNEVAGLAHEIAAMKVDLGACEENPPHYQGDGIVSCARAMRSMLEGWQRGDASGPALNGYVPWEATYWAVSAFKYIWRFPIKRHPREDLEKALDCCQRALEAWEEAE